MYILYKNYMNGVMEQNFAKLTIIEFMYSALMYMRFYCTFRCGSGPPRNLDMTRFQPFPLKAHCKQPRNFACIVVEWLLR